MIIGGSNHSSNNRLISDLPLRVYVKLICGPRSIVNPIDGPTLRSQILSKLHNTNIADLDYSYSGGNGGKGAKTIRDILHISPPILLRVLDPCLTYVECNRFLSRIHAECSVGRLSALEVIRRTKPTVSSLHKQGGNLHSNNDNVVNDDDLILLNGKISTGLPTLDGCLRGGIPIGSITEVVGRAGVGKTHLAQQLIVQAAMGGGGSIFIDAEKKLSLQRLRELALERRRRDVAVMMSAHTNTNQNSITDFAQQVLENVTIHSLLTTRELLDVLDNLEKEILLRNSEATNEGMDLTAASNSNNLRRLPVRLIVIDSIAAPIRRDFDMMGGSSATSSSLSSSSNTAANRASAIFQIAKRLKQLAYDHQLAVVVVNQVGSGHDNSFSSHNNNNNNQRNNTLDINDGEFTASLGTAWQYCATTRVVLEHEDDPHRLQQGGVAMHGNNNGLSIRSATLTKSLVSKKTRLTFELIQQGLVEVPTN